MKLIVLIIAIIAFKFVTNAVKLKSAKKLRAEYATFITMPKTPTDSHNSFIEKIPQAKKLFKDAGLDRISIPMVAPAGFGHIYKGKALIVGNLTNLRDDVVSTALILFDQMVGTFRMRMLESFSPFYWLEAIIFLPKHIINYLGGKENGLLTKISQIIYWIATPLLLSIRAGIYEYLIELLRNVK